MSGFSGIVIHKAELHNKLNNFVFPNTLSGFYKQGDVFKGENYRITIYDNNKFMKDVQFNENDKSVFGIEGVLVLNYESLNENINVWLKGDGYIKKHLNRMYGSFAGFSFNKETGEFKLFTDQTASRQVFYFSNDAFSAFSSSIFLLRNILSHFSVKISLNINSAYMMLSLGYMLKDNTLINEIKKLEAGNTVTITGSNTKLFEYHNYYKGIQHNKLTSDLLFELDKLFEKAIEAEYKKDLEYNYNHIATLSGGLDSRMNVMFAWDAGFKNILSLTFSDGLNHEEIIARQISNKLKIYQSVILLNSGLHLLDIETPLILNNCSVYYFGAAQTLEIVKNIDFSKFGLFHNGALAESSKGGYLSAPEHLDPKLSKRYAVSDKLFPRIQTYFNNEIAINYPNEEMFIHYSRGFNATHNGSWMVRSKTESIYPFMNPMFADLAFSIHPKLRYNSVLTIEWLRLLRKPIAKFPWTKYGIPPTNNKTRILTQRFINKFKRMINKQSIASMSIDNWVQTNQELRLFFDNIFNTKPEVWKVIPKELTDDIKSLYQIGSIKEKLLCISFLKSIELLFIKEKV